jgi:DNA-binding transcriptional LysR family regulator
VDLPASLGQFREKFPGVGIELLLDGAAPLLDLVNDGRLDLVFTQPGEIGPAMTTRMLACEDMALICAPDHPLTKVRVPTLAKLAGHTFVDLKADWGMRRLLDRHFAALEATRKIGFEVNDMKTLIDLVAQGLGVAVIPLSVARSRRADRGTSPVAVIELADREPLCWELVVAFNGHRGHPSDRVTKSFLDLLVSSVGKPVQYE